MDRRRFLLASLTTAVIGPLFADAQATGRITRIGYLLRDKSPSPDPQQEAFLHALRDLGYVEGRNLMVDYRSAEGNIERLPALATELVALKVDIIMAPSTVAALAARQTTSTVPIVSVSIPETSGLITSLARPGGTSPGSHGSPRSSSASVWNSSSRRFRLSAESLRCGSRVARVTALKWKRACSPERKSRLARWDCGFTRSRRAAQPTSPPPSQT